MDELDLVRALRADVPGPTDIARGRALRELRAEIYPGRRRRPPRGAYGVIAGTAAAAAAALLLLGPSGDDGLRTGEAVAAERLEQAAEVAERRPDPRAIGRGQLWYQRSIEARLVTTQTFSSIDPHVREQWLGRDGEGRVRTLARGERRFPTAADRRAWRAAGSPPSAVEMDVPLTHDEVKPPGRVFPFGARALTYEQLRALPTGTGELERRIRAAAGEPPRGATPDQMFTVVGDLLRGAPIPSDLRAALYRVAARIPGIRFEGEIADATGRAGVGISHEDQGTRHTLIFDPATAELLGERDLRVADDVVTGDAAYLESGVVGSVRERP